MTTFAEGKIEAYLGPTELGSPDDLESVLVDFIRGARTSLDVAVQEVDNPRIAQALVDARWRGVDVVVFMEQDYLRSNLVGRPPALPRPRDGETPEEALYRVQWVEDTTDLAENRRILSAMLRSDIEVHGDLNPKIFHQKFILRDYRGKASRTSALLTGSANFTVTDTHRNLNHLMVFHSAYVCKQYAAEFAQLRNGSFGRREHGDVPKVYDLAGVPVKVLFAPDHTPELEIIKQMLKGSKEIYFAIFTFALSSGIDDAMVAMAKGGVQVARLAGLPLGHDVDQGVVVLHGAGLIAGDGVDNVDEAADRDLDAGLLRDLAARGGGDRFAEPLTPAGQRPLALARRLAAADQQHAVALEDDDADADQRAVGIVVHRQAALSPPRPAPPRAGARPPARGSR